MAEKFKIDLVYLWCDGSDPEFVKERKYWEEKLGVPVSESNNDNKYVDHEELRYSLRSVYKNAPWINKIYIVTNGQVPKWLDLSKTDKIKIVTHSQIMPKDALPTFDSNSIETCLVNIPNLSEHFIYANDDMFMNRPVSPDFFFDKKGRPIIRLFKNILTKEKLEKFLYHRLVKYSNDLINEKYNKKYCLNPHHNIDAYLLSSCRECINEFKDEFDKITYSKFRQLGIQRNIFALYMMCHNQYSIVKYIDTDNTLYKQKESMYMGISDEKMFDCIKRTTPYLICLNDSCRVKKENLDNYKTFLQYLFPEKIPCETDEPITNIKTDILEKYEKLEKKYNLNWKIKNKLKYLTSFLIKKKKTEKSKQIILFNFIKITYKRKK